MTYAGVKCVMSTYECSHFRTEFAADSPLEEAGFEPSVPRQGTAFLSEGNELYPLPINHQVGDRLKNLPARAGN